MRIALPKGRLFADVERLLRKAGMPLRFDGDRDYSPETGREDITAKMIKPRAIPQLIALGRFDAGFCGLDLVREADYDEVTTITDLGFNRVQIVVAVPVGSEDIVRKPPKRPLVIATEYERMADRWALKKNLAHITVQTWGSTEAYAPDDADIVFDCRETGATMAANGLAVIEELMESTTYLVANRAKLEDRAFVKEIMRFAHGLREVL
jgi:ATP phosphoribosyltransferase